MNPIKDHHLPRLDRIFYHGDAVVHWSLTVSERKTGWLTEPFHQRFREVMLHTAGREQLFCPAYCLMPDHLHLMWMGLSAESDQLRGMTFFRTYLNKAIAPVKFQHQGYDHVLGDEERRQGSFAAHCEYVLSNPVRAELVANAREWRYSGAVVPGYPEMHPAEEGFWDTFWKLYSQRRSEKVRRALPTRDGEADASGRVRGRS